jgi:hypothetical protein
MLITRFLQVDGVEQMLIDFCSGGVFYRSATACLSLVMMMRWTIKENCHSLLEE